MRAGGHRTSFELTTESLRCPCCRLRFYFAEHAGRVWRTQCPNAVCSEVLVVTRDQGFRRRVERLGGYVQRVIPESPRFFQYIDAHWIEVAVAASLLLAVVPMVWSNAEHVGDAAVVAAVALSAALVCVLAFSWGAARWFHRRHHLDEQSLRMARELGRTPFVDVSASPGWLPES